MRGGGHRRTAAPLVTTERAKVVTPALAAATPLPGVHVPFEAEAVASGVEDIAGDNSLGCSDSVNGGGNEVGDNLPP